ncbi:MAG: DUF4249 domain-containing protein [Bacteroidales bacterium]|nr:DUF4249 domain-containing protein [Bacteroidales bacterium]
MKTNQIITRIILFISYVLTTCVFVGCVDDVNLEDQFNETRKLVLYARLCPQLDTTYILLSSTKLLYGGDTGDFPNISDAIVELSADGDHWVRAPYDIVHSRYFITHQELPVVEGGTYHIRASYPGYPDIAASCTVPVTHDVGFIFDTVAVDHDSHWGEIYNWPHSDVYVQWRDVQGEENAYALKTHYQRSIAFDDEDDGWGYYSEWLYEGTNELEYISDEGRDGAVMRFLLDADVYYEYDDWDEDKEGTYEYFLFFLDRGTYLYESTLTQDNELNFLLLEPLHTYTNIENGFGLFGAFSMLRVK